MFNDNPGAMQCCESKASIGRYIPPTKRQQLENKRATFEIELAKVNAAIEALDKHPELEQFINTIQAAE